MNILLSLCFYYGNVGIKGFYNSKQDLPPVGIDLMITESRV